MKSQDSSRKTLMRPLSIDNACSQATNAEGCQFVVWCNGGTFSQKAFRLTVLVRVRLRRQRWVHTLNGRTITKFWNASSILAAPATQYFITEHTQSFNVARTGRAEGWSRKARSRSNAALPIGDVGFESRLVGVPFMLNI